MSRGAEAWDFETPRVRKLGSAEELGDDPLVPHDVPPWQPHSHPHPSLGDPCRQQVGLRYVLAGQDILQW